MSKNADVLFTFYARNREEAEVQAQTILAKYGYGRLDLREQPAGFRIVRTFLPGRIEVETS